MAAKKAAKRKVFGIAGRVALIACGTAVAATLVQWFVTPILIRNSFDRARLQYARNAAQQLATLAAVPLRSGNTADLQILTEGMGNHLPEGRAALVAPDGRIIAANKGGAELLTSLGAGVLTAGDGAVKQGEEIIGFYPVRDGAGTRAIAILAMQPRTLISTWLGVLVYNALVFVLAMTAFAFFLLPLARRAMAPVTELEKKIRKRTTKDKSKLSESSDDRILKPLLAAIDEVHDRSEAAMRRALALAYADPVTRLPNRLRFV